MHRMLEIDDPREAVPEAVLDAPGGFAWWYAEVENEAGDGIVLIWSWGLPFLPGYVGAARDGAPRLPRSHPSLNVVVYKAGQEAFYSLRELAPEHATRAPGVWRFGDSTIRTHTEEGVTTLEADLCCPVAGSATPMRARVRLSGRQPTTPVDRDESPGGHRWTPLACPAFGTARVEHGDLRLAISGRAYHDRNHSHRGLQDLGIGTWLWGRASAARHERVYYVLWPEGGEAPEVHGWELDGSGAMRPRPGLRAVLPPRRTTRYGMPSWAGLRLMQGEQTWVDMAHSQRVEDGPFYLRWQTRGEAGGEAVHGTAEAIVPARIDLGRHRPLVRMRVASEQRDNSVWLPLFDGPRRDRLRRLLLREATS